MFRQVFFGLLPINHVMGNFKQLIIWQESKELAVRIYQLSNEGKLSKDFGLRDQIRKAAVSVPSNIAEGEEAGFNRLSIRFMHIAKASLAELFTQIQIAQEIGYLEDADYNEAMSMIEKIFKQIKCLIKHRQQFIK